MRDHDLPRLHEFQESLFVEELDPEVLRQPEHRSVLRQLLSQRRSVVLRILLLFLFRLVLFFEERFLFLHPCSRH